MAIVPDGDLPPGTHLFLRTQNGGRMWIDVNRDGVFADTPDELIDNRFGQYGGEFTSRASPGLASGLYSVRVQMHHSVFANRAHLLWDSGTRLSPGTSQRAYQFDGVAGQRLFFDSQSLYPPVNQASWTLYGPTNQIVGAAPLHEDFQVTLPADGVTIELRDPHDAVVLGSWNSASSDHRPIVLGRGGTYQLKLIGGSAGDYRFRLLNLADATPLTLATTYSNSSLPGHQTDVFSWQGSAGQLAFYDGLDLDFESIGVSLLDPNLNTVASFQHRDGLVPELLIESGPYYLLVKNGSATAGDYAFRMLHLADQPALPLADSQSGTLDPGTRTDVFRLTGMEGQRLFLQGELPATCAATWNVYPGAAGTWLAGGCLHSDVEFTLPDDGTYAVTLEGNSDSSVFPYQFRAYLAETVSGPLPGFGSEISGTIAAPGDQREYVFQGAAGQRVVFDALGSDSDSFSAAIYRPNGFALYSGNAEWDSSLLTLPESGEYRLVLDGQGRATGDFGFQLLDAADASAISLDAFVSGRLAEGSQTRLYQFAGTANQLLYFDAQGNGDTNAFWTLYGPGGTWLASPYVASDFETTLPVAGTYVLAVTGQAVGGVVLLAAAAGGSLDHHFRIVTPDTDTAPLTLGETYGGSFFFTQPRPGWTAPVNAAFGPNGDLYVVASDGGVDRYDGATGAWRDRFIASTGGFGPAGMVFGPDGDLYLADRLQNLVFRFDGDTGAAPGPFVAAGSGGLSQPGGLAFGPDGSLYVSSAGTDSVLRYDGTSGAFQAAFVAVGSGGLDSPRQLRFGPDGRLFVSSFASRSVLRYDGTTGARWRRVRGFAGQPGRAAVRRDQRRMSGGRDDL